LGSYRLLRLLTFRADVIRLQVHALAYNLANFPRTLTPPKAVADCVPDEPAREW